MVTFRPPLPRLVVTFRSPDVGPRDLLDSVKFVRSAEAQIEPSSSTIWYVARDFRTSSDAQVCGHEIRVSRSQVVAILVFKVSRSGNKNV